MTPEAHRQSYNDNVDRIEVKRGFSLAKRCYGLGLIRTKLDTTTRSSIALSIIAMNLDRLTAVNYVTMLISILSRYIWQINMPQKSIENIIVCDVAY